MESRIPLIARGHLGLGMLDLRTGRGKTAENHLTMATTMFREMGMTLWREKAKAAVTEQA